MYTKTQLVRKIFSEVNIQFYIILAWCTGLLLGLHIIPNMISATSWYMTTGVDQRGSFPLLLLFSVLPLLLTFYFIRKGKLFFLPFLCFMRSIFLGFSVSLVFDRFGSGAWLGRFLFLFTDSIRSFLLLWVSLTFSIVRKGIRGAAAFSIVSIVFACFFDSFCLTPFLNSIF